jgi:hypothetical protein
VQQAIDQVKALGAVHGPSEANRVPLDAEPSR